VACHTLGQRHAGHDGVADRRLGEHDLRPAEHGRALAAPLAPAQVDEALAALAVHERPSEVALAVGTDLRRDLDGPDRLLRVAGHLLDDLPLALHADVHVGVLAADPPRQVDTLDAEDHPHLGSTSA